MGTTPDVKKETRTVSSTGAAKGIKPEAFDLVPPWTLEPLARFYGARSVDLTGAHNWSQVFNYTVDHLWKFWGSDDTDPDTGLPRLISAAAGCFALYNFLVHPDLGHAYDDRKEFIIAEPLVPVTFEGDVPPARYDRIPYEPLAALARHYRAGAAKYAAHNWAAGYEWSKPFAALLRHLLAFWNGEDIDAETGSPHIVACAWHCLTISEFYTTHPEFDDRPVRGQMETVMSLREKQNS